MIKKLQRAIDRFNSHNSMNYSLLCKREIYRAMYEKSAFENMQRGIVESASNEEIVVSLTTYGERLRTVHLTIESIFCQTQKAQRVILWLSENEFSENDIPLVLRNMENRGLEIRTCPDYRSYKKLIPTLELCPDSIIVTIDDDIIYPRSMLEEMYRTHIKFPNCTVFNYGKVITKNENEIQTYTSWEDVKNVMPSSRNIGIGCGGIMYPPGTLHQEVANKELFTRIAPTTDDIWFKAMQILNKVKAVKNCYGRIVSSDEEFLNLFITTEDYQRDKLGTANVLQNENDIQLKNIFSYYNITIESI